MGYAYRIKRRLDDEGLSLTLKYFFCVIIYYFRSTAWNIIMDCIYSRRPLNGNKKTPYKHLGANDTYHTDYSAMPLIFQALDISPDDVLVDVGCGKGRIINYWLSKKLRNRIYGLELDPEICKNTALQFSGRRNVTIIPGDAVQSLPADGTVFYFYNPFGESKVREFEEKLRSFDNNEIRVIYYNPKSLHVFDNGFWKIQHVNFEKDMGVRRWGRINKYHDLCIIAKKVPGSITLEYKK